MVTRVTISESRLSVFGQSTNHFAVDCTPAQKWAGFFIVPHCSRSYSLHISLHLRSSSGTKWNTQRGGFCASSSLHHRFKYIFLLLRSYFSYNFLYLPGVNKHARVTMSPYTACKPCKLYHFLTFCRGCLLQHLPTFERLKP